MENTKIDNKFQKFFSWAWLYIFLILMLLLWMIVAYKVINRIEVFESDPFTYGMEKIGLVSCSCVNEDGRLVTADEEGIKIHPVPGVFPSEENITKGLEDIIID